MNNLTKYSKFQKDVSVGRLDADGKSSPGNFTEDQVYRMSGILEKEYTLDRKYS